MKTNLPMTLSEGERACDLIRFAVGHRCVDLEVFVGPAVTAVVVIPAIFVDVFS